MRGVYSLGGDPVRKGIAYGELFSKLLVDY